MIRVTGTYTILIGERKLIVSNRILVDTLQELMWSLNADATREAHVWYFSNADIPTTGPVTVEDTEAWGRVPELDAYVYDVDFQTSPLSASFSFQSNETSEEHTINGLAIVVYDGVGYHVVSVAAFSAETTPSAARVYTRYELETNL